MKSQSGPETTISHKVIHADIMDREFKPKIQKLDNKASNLIKHFMTNNGITFQLTPTVTHVRSADKRVINTWKNNFITTLCRVDPSFPLQL